MMKLMMFMYLFTANMPDDITHLVVQFVYVVVYSFIKIDDDKLKYGWK